ncbi:hypothetical protein M758_5G183100 [Ceratodon purpureus]|uniref:Uncharacterized protein n=2 Tax=Ceratodon purpureus TaxID=3225 RepID=A0A8T0I665_CERPU|nr:hypothetical protein KC19_5G190500 [Ceratodon purpureus]KAG0617344.1 hypothetical protein M758_5G183100 [Ceratodon purpureus]
MAALTRRSAAFLRSVRAMKPERSATCRFLSAAPKADDDIVKKVFIRQQKNFRTYLEEISKSKFDMDHNNENHVKAYQEMQARIRENLGHPSFTQKIADLLDAAADDAPDVRTILMNSRTLRNEAGIEDDMGADDMMLQALNRLEKSIGKPLTRDDANGMSQWKKEIDQINAKLKIKDEDLEKLEEEAEYAAAKAQLEEFRNVAFDKIDSIKRRDNLKVDVTIGDIDHRNYL